MTKRASIEFIEASRRIRGKVTKFGGQPVWMSTPQWPISKATGMPMQFIAQIAMIPEVFENATGQMAYLFMTDDPEADGTWEPDGGENAVIVQPGVFKGPAKNIVDGPTICRYVARPGHDLLQPEPCEFAVSLELLDDPAFLSMAELSKINREANLAYVKALDGNKIGGTPGFLQRDEFPGDDYRTLLLQLDSTKVPFFINFGGAGVGYAFLSNDGKSGKFIWQSG